MSTRGSRLQPSAQEFSRWSVRRDMPPLEAKKALFAHVAGTRRRRRTEDEDKLKLMFVDVKKARLNGRCDEEEE